MLFDIQRNYLLVVLLCACTISYAQVPNDNIENRLELGLNQALLSNTIGATVQWNCLNQDLTRSCIKYHNDQWFEFSVTDNKPYYLNVSNQDCRDIWGVQVLVFSGVPCEPDTYELITCYSDGNRDDIFITLDGLRPGTRYLVNVDGYLHDQCSFSLELSDTPQGIPVSAQAVGEVSGDVTLRTAEIVWGIPDTLGDQMKTYEIWKNTGDRSELIREVSHEMNAFGSGRLSYAVSDTLYTDNATYTVIGIANGGNRLFIGEILVRLDREALAESEENVISLNLAYAKGEEIILELWDADQDELLYTRNIRFDPGRHGNIKFRVMRFREDGVSLFKVLIKNKQTGEWDLRFFEK